jgi:hypothetical protein
MKQIIASMLFLWACASSNAQGTSCNLNFKPEIVKPGIFKSMLVVAMNWPSSPEPKRLTAFRQTILGLREQKISLRNTLQDVSANNSVPAWLTAKTNEIPAIESRILDLLRAIEAEYGQGGLFAGDPAYRELKDLVGQKAESLKKICLMANAQLPLPPESKQTLDGLIKSLNEEIEALGKIDDQLCKLIDKANGKNSDKKS